MLNVLSTFKELLVLKMRVHCWVSVSLLYCPFRDKNTFSCHRCNDINNLRSFYTLDVVKYKTFLWVNSYGLIRKRKMWSQKNFIGWYSGPSCAGDEWMPLSPLCPICFNYIRFSANACNTQWRIQYVPDGSAQTPEFGQDLCPKLHDKKLDRVWGAPLGSANDIIG